ncbi:pyridoxal phosphate-dependent aminotransferase [Cellulomonas marina]|uniref:Aspartate aminotransferase n=1 Tax=Cellulomonas marina TaxID=988821 RepID=A0A1I0W5R1_9CELL|nr:pyridoxal phosphate-dependent aminotransferase [Cellulomonas marina]GIG30514.1 aminotransferase [Cellulomonas marina]SFA84002.1 aspartate aminotransferase [Cellulomonas marina]
MPTTSRAAATVPRSGIRLLMELALRDPGAIHLEIGEPDLRTPAHVVEAAAAAARAGHTGYTSSVGTDAVRAVLADVVTRSTGRSTSADEVVVTHGAMNGLALAFAALLSPGETLLLPDPEFPNWRMAAVAAGLDVATYPCLPEHGFVPRPEDVEAALTPTTRAILLNSPNNPTGAVYPREVVEAFVDLARRHDLWLLSDECYDAITFDAEHVSPLSLDTDGRVVVFRTMSKTYAMTGWRLGYAVVPDGRALDLMGHLAEATVACPSSVSQQAAVAAVTGPQDAVADAVASYRSRRDAAVDLLTRRGIACVRPDGAFYLMVDVGVADTDAFALRLLRERHVAVAPGATFGSAAAGMVRVSLAAAPADLLEGLGRLADQVDADRAAGVARVAPVADAAGGRVGVGAPVTAPVG